MGITSSRPGRPVAEIEAELDLWVAAEGQLPGESRDIVKQRILEVYRSQLRDSDPIESLWLDSLGLTTIPDCVCELSELQFLCLDNNRLKYLPSQINKLQKLEILEAQLNCLRFVPDTITELSSLKSLNLSLNEITSLPDLKKTLPFKRTFRNDFDMGGAICEIPPTVIQYVHLGNNPLDQASAKRCDYPDSYLSTMVECAVEMGRDKRYFDILEAQGIYVKNEEGEVENYKAGEALKKLYSKIFSKEEETERTGVAGAGETSSWAARVADDVAIEVRSM